jgi:predicted outer membrane repeat protein
VILPLAGALVLLPALPASAASMTAGCAGLQAALDQAEAGNTITLNSSCVNQSFTLRSNPPGTASDPTITLRGLTGAEELNGGANSTTPVLTGTNVHRVIVTGLTFRNSSSSSNGGAISVTGDSALTVDNSSFFNNQAVGEGGAIYAGDSGADDPAGPVVRNSHFGSPDVPGSGNSASGNGGAVAIESISNSSVHDNTFDRNSSEASGGALYMADTNDPTLNSANLDWFDNRISRNSSEVAGGGVYVHGGAGHSFVTANTVDDNSVAAPVTLRRALLRTAQAVVDGDHFGGGAVLEFTNGAVDQTANTFDSNSIDDFSDGKDYGGGGEWISGARLNSSVQDEFLSNELPSIASTGAKNQGGGLGFLGSGSGAIRLHAFDLVAAGNRIGSGPGEGAGIYAACDSSCTATLDLESSTVAGNQVASDGSRPGIGGGDELDMENSIVFGNSGATPDIGGFTSVTAAYTDACDGASGGIGNFCADPLLADPANGDIHETGHSPTIDKGNDAFLQPDADGDEDFEGDLRSTDGDGDGHTVDVGADESPAFVSPPVQPAAPRQCADGKDNDNDGAIDLKDPGCSSAADDNEGDESLSALVLCGSRQISLVRADAVGKKAVLSGIVAAKYAGKKVSVYANYPAKGGLKKVASVKAAASGQFTAKLKLPSKKGFNRARFQVRIGNSRSATLKLPQSLASSSVKRKGAKIELRGKVKRSLVGKRNAVIVRRLTCGHYTKVGEAKPGKSGSYVVRFDVPAGSSAALYRAETRVLNKPHGKKYVKQYARAIGITLSK